MGYLALKSIAENERTASENEMEALAAASPHLQFWYLLKAMRPRQWTKNLLVFAGLVFAQRTLDVGALGRAIGAFVVFCLLASMIYLINDLGDLQSDRQHPTKRFRPLASGKLMPPVAVAGAVMLGVLATVVTVALVIWPEAAGPAQIVHISLAPFQLMVTTGQPPVSGNPYGVLGTLGGGQVLFPAVAAAYVALNLAYTFRLKHVVIIDVFCVAGCYVLRVMAGAFVIPVPISPWLYLCAILLSLFLALGKRRQELVLLEAGASLHRRILQEYSTPLLDQMIMIVTSATVMAYSLYTFQGTTGNHRLMLTIPFVLYGIFRYLYLIYMKQEGGSPDEVLLRDKHILGTVALCVLTTLALLYLSF